MTEAMAKLKKKSMSTIITGNTSNTHQTPNRAKYCALECKGVNSAMMTIPPLKIPAAPAPAKARPKIKTFILGATPQANEPISKIKTAKTMTCLEGKMFISWE